MLVLDANILVRSVLGKRVRFLLSKYAGQVDFVAPDTAFAEARRHLPILLSRRSMEVAAGLHVLDLVSEIVRVVEYETYARFETVAHQRMDRRDKDDWPVLACALACECPVWTEDNDFFGCGIATWTTDLVEHYLMATIDRQN